jgi:hypothetical protein
MLYFGSRNFGQANFGKGLITTAVDETLTTSTMQVAGYRFINTGSIYPKAITNVDIAAGMVRLGYLNITPDATIIASGVKMEWRAWTNLGQGTVNMDVSGYIAWDSQLTDAATWTTQTVS